MEQEIDIAEDIQWTNKLEAIVPNDERVARNELRRWCPVAELHQDPDDPECFSLDCTDKWTHRLRLRRMLICSVCEQGYFSKQAFECHDCWSAY